MSATATSQQEPEPIVQAPNEHQTVLAEAVRDDSEHYDDPLLSTS